MVFVLVLAHRNVGRVARTNFFDVVFRVRYWAPHFRSSDIFAAPLPWDDSEYYFVIYVAAGALIGSSLNAVSTSGSGWGTGLLKWRACYHLSQNIVWLPWYFKLRNCPKIVSASHHVSWHSWATELVIALRFQRHIRICFGWGLTLPSTIVRETPQKALGALQSRHAASLLVDALL